MGAPEGSRRGTGAREWDTGVRGLEDEAKSETKTDGRCCGWKDGAVGLQRTGWDPPRQAKRCTHTTSDQGRPLPPPPWDAQTLRRPGAQTLRLRERQNSPA